MAGLMPIESLYDSEIKEVSVPYQRDSFSCGWRTLYHAEYILDSFYSEKPSWSKVIFVSRK